MCVCEKIFFFFFELLDLSRFLSLFFFLETRMANVRMKVLDQRRTLL